jgi:hypothetical protein
MLSEGLKRLLDRSTEDLDMEKFAVDFLKSLDDFNKVDDT